MSTVVDRGIQYGICLVNERVLCLCKLPFVNLFLRRIKRVYSDVTLPVGALPITSLTPHIQETKTAIHFSFNDGTSLQCAYTYDWKLYTIQQTIDVLKKAGFSSVRVFVEQVDADGHSEEEQEICGDKFDFKCSWYSAQLVAVV